MHKLIDLFQDKTVMLNFSQSVDNNGMTMGKILRHLHLVCSFYQPFMSSQCFSYICAFVYSLFICTSAQQPINMSHSNFMMLQASKVVTRLILVMMLKVFGQLI